MFSCVVFRVKLGNALPVFIFITLPMEEKVNLLKSLSRKKSSDSEQPWP